MRVRLEPLAGSFCRCGFETYLSSSSGRRTVPKTGTGFDFDSLSVMKSMIKFFLPSWMFWPKTYIHGPVTLRRAKFLVPAGNVYFTLLPVITTFTPRVSAVQLAAARVAEVSTTKPLG